MKVTVTIFPLAERVIWNPDKAIDMVSNAYLVMPCGARFLMKRPTDYPGRGQGAWAPQEHLQATFTAYPRFPHSSVRFDCAPHFKEQDISFVQTIGQYQVMVECKSE